MRGNANLAWGPLEGAPRRYGSNDWGYAFRENFRQATVLG